MLFLQDWILTMTYRRKGAFVLLGLIALSACGGSGSGGVASASAPLLAPSPPPPPPPPPPPTANDTSVELLAAPATQELAVLTRDSQIQIRYDASRNVYEMKAGNFDWSAITDPPDPSGDTTNRYFNIAGQPGSSYFSILAHNRASEPSRRYQYSNLASWQANGAMAGDFGNFAAFGTATPASGVPVRGSASFQGFAVGEADIKDTGWGFSTTHLEGPVKLDFDFAAGSLSGSIALGTACDCSNDVATGTIAFSNTVYSRGSQTFSGSFATGVTGINSFDGRFTGPAAEELIGSWSLPFLFAGTTHQAWGAWIAKRKN